MAKKKRQFRMPFYNVQIGDTIVCYDGIPHEGKVIAIYPYFFLVDFGKYKECFSWWHIKEGVIEVYRNGIMLYDAG